MRYILNLISAIAAIGALSVAEGYFQVLLSASLVYAMAATLVPEKK